MGQGRRNRFPAKKSVTGIGELRARLLHAPLAQVFARDLTELAEQCHGFLKVRREAAGRLELARRAEQGPGHLFDVIDVV